MIRGLGDYKKDDKSKDKKKPNTSYAGGESSGMAVEHPDLEGIVQKAREGGQQEEKKQGGPPKTELKITLYSNGFVVDDGAFRPYEAEENKQFMKELNEGYVPKEIQNKYKGGVSVGLEDRRKDTYRPPTPPPYTAYSGSGANLGGTEGKGLEVNKNAGGLPDVDTGKPTTTINIRFHNGESASITLNLSHTVGDIHTYVMIAAPVDGEYQLITGFPPKPLSDPSKTIEQAGLKNARITQKIL